MSTVGVRSVVVDGQRLRVAVRPGLDSGGPPLLVCNGIGAPLDVLEPFVAALDPAIDVVRFDVPGTGGSPPTRYPYRLHWLARLAGGLLDELGYHRFDALGVSWGGALAQQLALQNPRRCRRLVLVATATGSLMVPARPGVLLRMVTPRRYRDPDYLLEIAGEIYGGRLRTQPDLAKPLIAAHGQTSGRGYLLQLLASAGWTSLPWLRLIRQPTLVLAGDDDPIVPLVNARIMAKLLPCARLHVYPDGHLGLAVRADELAPVIASFLAAPEPPPAPL